MEIYQVLKDSFDKVAVAHKRSISESIEKSRETTYGANCPRCSKQLILRTAVVVNFRAVPPIHPVGIPLISTFSSSTTQNI